MGQYIFARIITLFFFLLVSMMSLEVKAQLSWKPQGDVNDTIFVKNEVFWNGSTTFYPNEATGEILHAELDLPAGNSADIVVRDAQGKIHILIPGRDFSKGINPVSLSVHNLQAGTYCFTILNKAGVLYERNFIKL